MFLREPFQKQRSFPKVRPYRQRRHSSFFDHPPREVPNLGCKTHSRHWWCCEHAGKTQPLLGYIHEEVRRPLIRRGSWIRPLLHRPCLSSFLDLSDRNSAQLCQLQPGDDIQQLPGNATQCCKTRALTMQMFQKLLPLLEQRGLTMAGDRKSTPQIQK